MKVHYNVSHLISILNVAWTLLLCNLMLSGLYAQLPKTRLYMGDIKYNNLQPSIKNLKFLSDFNPDGYNNQPYFFGYNEVYVSAAQDTQKFTDIYKLNIREHIITRFTDTYGISEFSPTPIPASDNLSVIRIEADGKTQSLWVYPKDASSKGKRLFKDVDNPGYHCWLSSSDVALFLVGDPHQLVIGNVNNGQLKVITTHPGRCLRKSTDGKLVFVHKESIPWVLKSYDNASLTFNKICNMPEGVEDFDILANGTILCGSGSKILYFQPEKNTDWKTAEDLNSSGIENISRITAMRDRLVFVSTSK